VRPAAVGEGWHVGVVTVHAEETQAVLAVFGIGAGRRFHTGRMAVPGGVTFLVVTPPAGPGGVAAALAGLCARYDPPVVVQVSGGVSRGVALSCGRDPVVGAVDSFFAAAGEPATLPGYGGAPAFHVARGVAVDDEVPRFCASATTRRGKPVAWAVIRGDTASRNAAQALRYLIPYLRPRL
jgi:hypothetical protein